ncbi:MAG: hypothetical protein WC931_05175 [Bacilli bacterium]
MATSFRGFSAQCGAVHFCAIQQIYSTREIDMPYVTIGDVLVRGKPRYGASYQKLKQAKRHGLGKNENIDCHVWLTFPDMTIFDLTLGVGLAYEREKVLVDEQKDCCVIWGKPEELLKKNGLDYRPYLVGHLFLFQSGMLEPTIL